MANQGDRSYVDEGIVAAEGWPGLVEEFMTAEFDRVRPVTAEPTVPSPPIPSAPSSFDAATAQILRCAQLVQQQVRKRVNRNAAATAVETARWLGVAVPADKSAEALQDVRDEQVRLDIGGTRERVVEARIQVRYALIVFVLSVSGSGAFIPNSLASVQDVLVRRGDRWRLHSRTITTALGER